MPIDYSNTLIYKITCKDVNVEDRLVFIGTEYHKNNKIGISWGDYKIVNNSLEPKEITQDFVNSDCEKNWVFCNYKEETHIIYSWSPLRICKIDENTSKLNLVETKKLPKYFKNVRGSSSGFTYENEIWFICHIVSYETPRHYYNIISVFDENMDLLRYSFPFKFSDQCIEYSLGLIVEDTQIIMTYSELDKSSKIGIFDKSYIDKLLICN